MNESDRNHRLREPLWFVAKGRIGSRRRHGAELASPGALVAEDHEGGMPLGPALGQIGAERFLAYGGHAAVADDPLCRSEISLSRQRSFEPGR